MDIGAFTPEQARLIWQDYLSRQQLAPELAKNLPNRRLALERTTRRVQCLLTEHLYAANNTRNDPSSAVARVFRRKNNGKLRLTNDRITVVNRFMEISVDEGTYCKAEWIDGEWQLYAADCAPGQSSSVSEGV